MKKTKYEAKQFRNIFRVINTETGRSITKDIPNKEDAEEIAEDFNKMESGDLDTIAAYRDVHQQATAPKPIAVDKNANPIDNLVLIAMASLPGVTKDQVRKRVLYVTSPEFLESIGIDKRGPQSPAERMFVDVKIAQAMNVNIK